MVTSIDDTNSDRMVAGDNVVKRILGRRKESDDDTFATMENE